MRKSNLIPSLWGHVPFRRYILAYLLWVITQQMQTLTISWYVYKITQSEWALGVVGLVQFVPVLCLSLLNGYLLDRVSRKLLLIISLLGYVITSSGLIIALWFRAPIVWIYVLLAGAGCSKSLYSPARVSLFPQIAPPGEIASALVVSSAAMQFGFLVGPTVAGVLLARFIHPSWFCAAHATTSFLFVLSMRSISITKDTNTKPAHDRRLNPWSEMWAGARFLFQNKLLLSVVLLDLFVVLFGGATTLLPVYAEKFLHGGAAELGLLRMAPSMGAFGVSLLLVRMGPWKRSGKALLVSLCGFGIATILFGYSRWFWFSFVMVLWTGGFDQISINIRSLVEQVHAPEHLRGRISSVTRMFIEMSNELGGFESGAVAALIGAKACVVLGGVATLLLVAVVALCVPVLRKLGSISSGS